MEQMNLQITQTAQPTFTVEVVQNLIPVITAQVLIGAGSGGAKVVFGDTMTGTGTPADPVNVSEDILQDINNANELAEENAREISIFALYKFVFAVQISLNAVYNHL